MPSGVRTLASIRASAQDRADQVGSNFISTAQWNENINLSLEGLYDILAQKFGDDYFVSDPPPIITTDGANYLYALPTDFYKLLGVDQLIAGQPNTYIPIDRFNLGDRGINFYQGNIPQAGQQVRLWYVPRFVELVNDTDTADGVSGWLEYVIVEAAMKAVRKEEGDTSDLERDLARIERRIESAAANRDAGTPQTVVDTMSRRRMPFPIGYGGGASLLRYRLSANNIWLENTAFWGGALGY